MIGGAKAFRWGERPPKWFMKEVSKAFELMGKNREVAHIFDAGQKWSFVFLIVDSVKARELAIHIQKWYDDTYSNGQGNWPLVDSETKEPWKPE